MWTIDLGNTRLKACRWDPASRTLLRQVELASADFTGLADLVDGGAEPVAVGSVAGAERTRALVELLERSGARVVEPRPEVENTCREPARVGSDRLHAAAGAAELLGVSTLVVDAGTALTVDAVLVEGGRRAFLGGAIAPGPRLAARALALGTAQLPEVEPRPGVAALGKVTEEAILAGIGVGFRGAAAELVEAIASEAGLESAPVVLTGGAREFLLRPRPFTPRRLEIAPHLVHLGLLGALLREVRAERQP